MTTDTLTADGAPVVISAPAITTSPSEAFSASGYAVVGPDQVDVLWFGGPLTPDPNLVLAGYSLDGSLRFQETILPGNSFEFPSGLQIVGQPGSGAMVAFAFGGPGAIYATLRTMAFDTAGTDLANTTSSGASSGTSSDYFPRLFASPTGYHLEWEDYAALTGVYSAQQQDYTAAGQPVAGSASSVPNGPSSAFMPYAGTQIGGAAFTVEDNQAQLAGAAAVTIPGEPSAAITDLAAAGLAGGTAAAVAWVDSGTGYVSIFNAATDSFGPVIGVDWGGMVDLHLVALPDGGFALSWLNGNGHQGEVFDAAGHGGGIIPLAGDLGGIDSHGDLFTVALNSSNQYVVQTYAINGGGSSGGGGGTGGSGSTVSTSAADYTAPDGVSTIILTGSNQTIHANNAGDLIVSNDTGNVLYGGTGNDTFDMGRGGDWAQGNGGNDTFVFAGLPWAAGGITDFSAGDVIDLTGLLHQIGYDGSDPVGAHLLDIAPVIGGVELQVFFDGRFWNAGFVYGDGVSTSSLQVNGDLITMAGGGGGGGPTDVSTAAANYTAPASVTSITLTGSQQTIDASATSGVTINSNDTGNVLIGGPGNDVFHLGRGGDWATGGAGADTFAYAAIPWAGGTITDFNAAQGDSVDVSGLLANAGFTGTDPFADGYLKYGTDGSGNAQLFADYNLPGNDGWWLVATLDGVSTSSLHYASGLIT